MACRPTENSTILGQVMTPPAIARQMVRELLKHRGSEPARIMDPCTGPGTFLTAMNSEHLLRPDDLLIGVDVDPAMVAEAQFASRSSNARTDLAVADYMLQPMDAADFVIMNPPYVRQEWIDLKASYSTVVEGLIGKSVPGTANLYVYFITKAVAELATGGKFAFIVYDSWQYTRFGRWLADRLSESCDDVRVDSVVRQPFGGRLIDATILYGQKSSRNPRSSAPQVTPSERIADGWTTIDAAFVTRRGLRLKQADFFRCRLDECHRLGGTPFLKKVGRIKGYAVPVDHDDAAILVLDPKSNQKGQRALETRLASAMVSPDGNDTILNWYRQRPDDWMLHRPPPFAPIVFNYYLRNRPRHLHNPTHGYSDNFYGLVSRTQTDTSAWLAVLNSSVVSDSILSKSRNQGGGLSKIQLYEYRNVMIPDLAAFSEDGIGQLSEFGSRLVDSPGDAGKLIPGIDTTITEELLSRVALSRHPISDALVTGSRRTVGRATNSWLG